MRWPIQPLEIQRRFTPRFCPRRDCSQHLLEEPSEFRYRKEGFYLRRDGRRVRRYRCSACRRTFSKQSFAVSYFLKRPELLVPVAGGLVNGAAHRQIGRMVGCAPSTVTRLSARIGRHCLLLQVLALLHLGDDLEDVVLDHAESFEGSQDEPFAVGTLVGKDSWFVYGLEGSIHERSGRRSEHQEARRRRRPPRRDPRGGYRGSAKRLLSTRLSFAPRDGCLRVVCDDLKAYRRAVREPSLGSRVELDVYANPERGPKGAPRSRVAITRDRAMFANDLLHSLMRHSLAHHHRETIAFPRRANAELERLFVLAAWRNFVKRVSERRPELVTPATRKGLALEPWSWRRVFSRRLFPDRLPVPPSWVELYRRDWITPSLPSNTRHRLRLAF